MEEDKRKKFAELLQRYGTDFDRIAETRELGTMTIREMASVYPEVLELYLEMNTALSEGDNEWSQIREVYYLGKEFYFDVLVPGPGGMDLLKHVEKLKAGKDLILLLKDYEFKLLSKLSILRRLYKTLISGGFLKDGSDISKAAEISSVDGSKYMDTPGIGEREGRDAPSGMQLGEDLHVKIEDSTMEKNRRPELDDSMEIVGSASENSDNKHPATEDIRREGGVEGETPKRLKASPVIHKRTKDEDGSFNEEAKTVPRPSQRDAMGGAKFNYAGFLKFSRGPGE